MKLYLSSYRIPEAKSLEKLLEKPLSDTSVALIPNAKDYYAKKAWDYKVQSYLGYFASLGMSVNVVDLREFSEPDSLRSALQDHDMIWAAGGNTFCLRYEMQRSGFDACIKELLAEGKVYGGDSAGAIVAGVSLKGIEAADIPEFAPEIIHEGLGLVPHMILPHIGNPEFAGAMEQAKALNSEHSTIELTDAQAAIFHDDDFEIVTDHTNS